MQPMATPQCLRGAGRASRSDSQRTAAASVPDEPWLEKNWNSSSDAYMRLRQLYSGYFDHIQRADEEEKALIDLVLCQLNSFVGVDALLDRKLLLLLVNSFAKTTERHLYRQEFIRLMFFLSFASKEQLEEAVFDIVSAGEARVSVAQLVQMHSYSMQRRMTGHVINLISECDRSGCGLLDVYDFRLLIGKLQEMEHREYTQAQPPLETERAKLEEALLEAQELTTWTWDLKDIKQRSSSHLHSLIQCRGIMHEHPRIAESISKLAWDWPEMMSFKVAKAAAKEKCTSKPPSVFGPSGLSSDDADEVTSVPSDDELQPPVP